MSGQGRHETWRGLSLDAFQRDALQAIDAGRSVLVSAPTGTGKTLIADYLVDQVLSEGGRLVYTAPVKALTNQKYREYCRQFGAEQVGLVTGDIVINRDAPLQIMTTEILRNILLQGIGPEGEQQELGELRAVILDELHFIDDPERGTVWEEVLIYLPATIRILGLSATLSNLEELAGWLSAVRGGEDNAQHEVVVVREERRAVPLTFYLANREAGRLSVEAYQKRRREASQSEGGRGGRRGRGRGRGRRGGDRPEVGETHHTDLVQMLSGEDMPALFFVFSRKATERYAQGMVRRRTAFLTEAERQEVLRAMERFDKEHPGVLQPHHRTMYQRGIAFHHAGLHVGLKNLVETLYEQRLIKLLYCTSTFALGINMPARTVLFEALEKYNGQEIAPLTVRQFMQKAGRAGRRGLDASGQVIIKMEYAEWPRSADLVERLLSGRHEPVRSAFNLSFHSVVNLLERHSEAEIRRILERSFLAYQESHQDKPLVEAIAVEERRLQMAREDRHTPEEALREQQERYAENLRRLRRKLDRQRDRIWGRFQAKVHFLKEIGYLAKDGSFAAGARFVRNVQIQEILMAELLLAGVFEDLSPSEVYGVCTGLVNALPRQVGVRAYLPAAVEAQIKTVLEVVEGPVVQRAQELAGGEVVCDLDMMALGYLWAEGRSLEEISERIRAIMDVSGDLVGAFRRAKDLVGQVRLVFWEDEPRRKALADMIKAVTRDEVEAV